MDAECIFAKFTLAIVRTSSSVPCIAQPRTITNIWILFVHAWKKLCANLRMLSSDLVVTSVADPAITKRGAQVVNFKRRDSAARRACAERGVSEGGCAPLRSQRNFAIVLLNSRDLEYTLQTFN